MEGIVAADLDLELIGAAKTFYDAAGHYTRNDVFRFSVNHAPRRGVHDAGLAPPPRPAAATPRGAMNDA